MEKIVASIKLAPGNRGYFDPLTGINLSISSNIGYVREGDDVSNIRRDIKNGKIKVSGGKLPPAISIKKIVPVKETKTAKEIKPVILEVKKPQLKKEIIEPKEIPQEIKPVTSTIILKSEKKKTKKEVKKEVKEEIKETPKEQAKEAPKKEKPEAKEASENTVEKELMPKEDIKLIDKSQMKDGE